jgi:6-pyruvoyltetrahydropterin/6-carboxytetrahydropterin synthase
MPRLVLEKKFAFEASHQLMHQESKCSRLHGHSWHGSVILENNSLQSNYSDTSMGMEFRFVGNALEGLVNRYLNHQHLNESLKMDAPTSASVAKWIYDRLKFDLPLLVAVTIEGACDCKWTYRGNG